MTDSLVVFSTCGDAVEAQRIAHAVVSERLAACVNILPAIQSVYRWQEKIESAEEVVMLMKTTQERFPALRDRIVQLHSYDTPEIIALTIAAGAEKYLAWLGSQV